MIKYTWVIALAGSAGALPHRGLRHAHLLGGAIGLFRGSHFDQGDALFIGTWQTAMVDRFERIVYNTTLYPNPATTTLNIKSADYEQPVVVYDILGHEAR